MANEILQLELDSFEGPFDLLLHLIRQMKVDINDIPMAEITQQYLIYIESMQEFQLDIVGDYLVMASTLIEIKSRLLLPTEPDQEMEDDDEEGDPRAALVQQLLLYQEFQTVATQLEQKQTQRAHLYSRPAADVSAYHEFVPLEPNALTLTQLADAMKFALEKLQERQPLEREVHHDPLTVSQQIDKIYQAFDRHFGNGIMFDSLIETGTRSEIITTFIAMLELVKGQKVIFEQANKDEPIKLLKLGEV